MTKDMSMKFILPLLLISVFLHSDLFSQDSRLFKFAGSVTDKSDSKPLEGFLVDVYEGNDIFQSVEVGKKNQFEVQLMGGREYTIDISMVGYYPKRVVVRTNVPKEIKKLPLLKFEVEMIRKSDYTALESIDPFSTSIFDLPYVVFEYDKNVEDFNYRESYTEHIKEKYAEVDDLR